jgi:hypothetical protein
MMGARNGSLCLWWKDDGRDRLIQCSIARLAMAGCMMANRDSGSQRLRAMVAFRQLRYCSLVQQQIGRVKILFLNNDCAARSFNNGR